MARGEIGKFKEKLLLCRMANLSSFTWGHAGLGKSVLHREMADDLGIGFIDMRLSQAEASDLMGLPYADIENDRTRYLSPELLPKGDLSDEEFWALVDSQAGTLKTDDEGNALPMDRQDPLVVEARRVIYEQLQGRRREGILFLDEPNRAQDDVLQAVFQLVLDRKVGNYVLPIGWSIHCAGNYANGGYQTNGFNDAAFLDRFCHIHFVGGESTLEEWCRWGADKYGEVASGPIEFATQNIDFLDGKREGTSDLNIEPSRRSWEFVMKAERAFNSLLGTEREISNEARVAVLRGLLGNEVASAYADYSCPVKPREVLAHGVEKMEAKLSKLDRKETVGLAYGMVSFAKGKVNEDDKVGETCADFAEYLILKRKEKDIGLSFVRMMVDKDDINQKSRNARMAVLSNPNMEKLLGSFIKNQGGKKDFLTRLMERDHLKKPLQNVAWGNDINA